LAALAVRYGVADVQVTSVDVAPGEMLDVAVRNPAKPDQVDRCTCDGEWLSEPSPVMVSALEDLDARAFTISDVPALSRVESRIDDGFAQNCFEEGRVAGISVNRVWPTVFVVRRGSRRAIGPRQSLASSACVVAARTASRAAWSCEGRLGCF